MMDGISLRSKICLGVAGLIMAAFFIAQSLVVFHVLEASYFLAEFGYACIIAFMPPFYLVVSEFLHKKEETTQLLGQKNAFLEHAAKIIRHDMHSGINTYIPRGVKSLKRRLTEEQLKELRIGAPLQLIEDGCSHAQKVYSGVFEFTNLFKNSGEGLQKETFCFTKALTEYLRLTAYSSQVDINKELCEIHANEALLLTAVDNLIRNGLKYNDSSTKLVKIYKKIVYDDRTAICIEDNGRGLTQEQFDILSQPYIRGENQSESGSGLGLNICVEIVKQHGFDISCQKIENGTLIKIIT